MLAIYEQILGILDETGGFTTSEVARRLPQFGSNKHQHSGAVRSWLLQLYARGLVDYLDNQRPVCWKRTARGTEEVEARKET